jgi:hypothetical protein
MSTRRFAEVWPDRPPWLVSGPYVLVRDVCDARISGLRARTEVLELDEDGFADELLLP